MVWTKGKESVCNIRVSQTSGKYQIVGVVRALPQAICINWHQYICFCDSDWIFK